ncbi:2-succinyl-5-enolpyruvyl-6-hydroxy-3-cyclohexene-1-carboxylate synthase [Salirhabdus euzebyi]|uniref:2-succinyl-5-enolpyruvyl-6-hydroxy-3-cyclohexene-1-carboxylate synthase n=1 Tax=Salirhabdus euzebyi TaxID=394506 RepID=A0A841Q4T5_9BACI|nr:2-succinyl-5-enolpyruvyl-6-hydroxy-3-cyclohexene-1-carboxylic-acid synthase [Salirhabdus euzebyi]MBB6453404.1 2-succinyl-5-enolpyruvyl-6-hydroxy-3-cyclohexene-1-carboxylate synthase [Salirhabdus euzebyi]
MNHTENLSYFVAHFVDELSKSGVTDVVISPGSRSTPLALMFAEHPKMKHWVNLDERSASFFALGMAKEINKPVVLLCTSGTAAANYLPAIVEAYYSRVPLIVVTADRPHELRDVGAPQAIDQVKMYGDYVKWFHEMALPEIENNMLHYVRSIASRAVSTAEQDNAGPVHLNVPLREPLIPNFFLPNLWGKSESSAPFFTHFSGKKELSERQLEGIVSHIKDKAKGLIVCGPQMDMEFREAIFKLAMKWNVPVLADPLSQLRAGKNEKGLLIEAYDTILKSSDIRAKLKPDYIIRFGAMPVSKPYLFFVKENRDIPHYVVESTEGYREPALLNTQYVYADPHAFCLACAEVNLENDAEFTNRWIELNNTVKRKWKEDSEVLTEGHAVTTIQKCLGDNHILYVGNSMPIRDVDTFFMGTSAEVKIIGNRGANGIDGIVSSAIGAAAHGKKVTLLIGDLSFYHDMNGLLAAKQCNIDLTIVLINNNGGGIFSFLPQAQEPKHFEVLFGTPLDLSFQKIAHLYEGYYARIESWSHFEDELEKAYQSNGIKMLEIVTNRDENVSWHRELWQDVEKMLLRIVGNH